MFKPTELKRILKTEGRTRIWLASKVGLSNGTISRYLSGAAEPPKPVVMAFASVFAVDLQIIWEEPQQKAS